MALREWGLTPEYINRQWTEELLTLMFISRSRRIRRHYQMSAGEPQNVYKVVSEEELFKQVGYQPEEVRFNAN